MNPAELSLWQKIDEALRETVATEIGGGPADPTNDYKVKLPPSCEGCGGGAHGSVNGGRLCLVNALRATRAALAAERSENAAFKKLRDEVRALPFDPNAQRNWHPIPGGS